jgi:hypothetical protein
MLFLFSISLLLISDVTSQTATVPPKVTDLITKITAVANTAKISGQPPTYDSIMGIVNSTLLIFGFNLNNVPSQYKACVDDIIARIKAMQAAGKGDEVNINGIVQDIISMVGLGIGNVSTLASSGTVSTNGQGCMAGQPGLLSASIPNVLLSALNINGVVGKRVRTTTKAAATTTTTKSATTTTTRPTLATGK